MSSKEVSPLAIVLAIVVLAVVLFVVWKLTFGKPSATNAPPPGAMGPAGMNTMAPGTGGRGPMAPGGGPAPAGTPPGS